MKLVALVAVTLLLSSCSQQRESKRIPVGPDAQASMVFYFKTDVSEEQVSNFFNEVITRPGASSGSFTLREGVQMISRVFHQVEGHKGIAIRFFDEATQEQRDAIRREAKAHPLVYKIIEDVAPADVKKLD